MSQGPWDKYLETLYVDSPSTKYFDRLKIVSSLFLVIVSYFAHQYGKTRAAATGLTFAIAVGTWGLYSPLQRKRERHKRVLDETIKIKKIAKKIYVLWDSIAAKLVKDLKNKTCDSIQTLNELYQTELDNALKQPVSINAEYKVGNLIDIEKLLVTNKVSKLSTVEKNKTISVEPVVLDHFKTLLNVCQMIAYGYLFEDNTPTPDVKYVVLGLDGNKPNVQAHSIELTTLALLFN